MMVRPTLIDLNLIGLNYYPFMISLINALEFLMLMMIDLQKYASSLKEKT